MAKKGRRPSAPKPEGQPDETKEQKFKRLADKRVNTALKKIKLIGNLSGSGYSYTEEQITKINDALADCVESTMGRFDKTRGKAEGSAFAV